MSEQEEDQIDILESVIGSEIRLGILERALGYIVGQNEGLNTPSEEDIAGFEKEAIMDVNDKYPGLDIETE